MYLLLILYCILDTMDEPIAYCLVYIVNHFDALGYGAI